jgi:hypothetical protein
LVFFFFAPLIFRFSPKRFAVIKAKNADCRWCLKKNAKREKFP